MVAPIIRLYLCHGMPAFRQVLTSVASAYTTKRDQIFEQAQKLTDLLQRTGELATEANELSTVLLRRGR